MANEIHEQNRLSWNEATRAHNSHKRDQAGFLRQGGSTVFPDELELLGPIKDQALVHLCCNSGQDSLSLARLGAVVTGVDISDEAIAVASRLSEESGLPARFERADVYDWLEGAAKASERYDVAFWSYGALPWLSDLDRLMRGVHDVLAPDGRLVMIEFHPAAMMLDEDWKPRYPYGCDGKPFVEETGVGDYVALSGDGLAPSGFEAGETAFENPHPSCEFSWSPAQVIQAALDAGLRLETVREYPYANGARMWKRMRELPGRRYAPPEDLPPLPLMWGLVARRP